MGIFLQEAVTGFLVKSVASFDDTLTRIPVMAELTHGKMGRIAFSIGTLLALTLTLILVIPLSYLLDLIPFRQFIVAGLIFLLGLAVYFEVFSSKKEKALQRKIIQRQDISHSHFLRLIGIGFVISLITYLDDMVVLIPLFLGSDTAKFFSIVGIYLAALLQITIVIYFSHQISRIKYKKEIASLALLVLAVLVGVGVV